MPQLSNSPQDSTTLQVEQRKSFMLGVLLHDINGNLVDLTGATASLVAAKIDSYSVPTPFLIKTATITNPQTGYLEFPLQAAELDPSAKLDYWYTVTLVIGGYSTVLLKGALEFVPNPETASTGETYTTAPPVTLTALLQQNVVHVDFNTVLPPTVARVPGGGSAGQVLVKVSPTSYDLAWGTLVGGLTAAGQLASKAPVSVGDGTWTWTDIATQAELNTAITNAATDATTKANAAQAAAIAAAAIDATTKANAAATASIPKSLVDAKGDLIVGQANDTPVRFVVGTTGQVLIVDPAATNGVRWADITVADPVPAGFIAQWSGNAAPPNWLLCQGQAVSRTTYASLFAVVGTIYGVGDGSTTFNLPNYKGRVPVGLDVSQTEFATIGQLGGEKTHLLTVAEMPSHGHPARIGNAVGGDGSGFAYSSYTTGSFGVVQIQGTGGGGAHNILQPYLALNFIIKVTNGDTPGDSQLTTRVSTLEARELAGLRPVKPTSVSLNAGSASISADGIVTLTNANGFVLNGITRLLGTNRYKLFCRLTSATGDYFFARFATAGTGVAGALYQGGTNYRQGTTGTVGNFQSLNNSTYMVAGYVSASYSDMEIDINSVNSQWPSLATINSYGMGINHTNVWGHWVYTDTAPTTRDGLWLSMNGSGLVSGTIEVYEYVR